jgi:oxygen-dependent protoporphyrinogen oxidase
MGREIVIVGAGIAGLTAAFRLDKAGFDVQVIEASDRVGGRMSTDRRDGFLIDRGAQFLSTGYAVIRQLVAELNMEDQWTRAPRWAGIVRDGRARRASAFFPWTVATGGLLHWGDTFKLGWKGRALSKSVRNLPLSDYSRWGALDNVSTAHWAVEKYGADVLEYIFEPMLGGLYFQSPEQTSAALAAQLGEFAARRTEVVALCEGMGSLPERLASRVPVRLNAPVQRIEPLGNRYRITARNSSLEADHVVIATTASTARALYPLWNDLELRLLATEYSSTINIGFATSQHASTAKVPEDVYGILIPRRERTVISGIAIESRKCAAYVPRGDLLNVMLSGEAGARLVDAPEENVLAEVIPELNRYFPAIQSDIEFAHFCRWPEAEPLSHVGRSKDIAEYRDKATSGKSGVLLAGDFMSFPTTEGAAESGEWAASVFTGTTAAWAAG